MSRLLFSHYTKEPLQYDPRRKYVHLNPNKPTGLWVSIDSEYGWKDYCLENEFDWLKYSYDVTLKSTAHLLHLDTDKSIVAFYSEYGFIDKTIEEYRFWDERKYRIDWGLISTKYDGIIISPFQYNLSYEFPQTYWYCDWSCASGCIWNLEAIATIEKKSECK